MGQSDDVTGSNFDVMLMTESPPPLTLRLWRRSLPGISATLPAAPEIYLSLSERLRRFLQLPEVDVGNHGNEPEAANLRCHRDGGEGRGELSVWSW